jgi:hypothetical protein
MYDNIVLKVYGARLLELNAENDENFRLRE